VLIWGNSHTFNRKLWLIPLCTQSQMNAEY
jgi:hypothetical protein